MNSKAKPGPGLWARFCVSGLGALEGVALSLLPRGPLRKRTLRSVPTQSAGAWLAGGLDPGFAAQRGRLVGLGSVAFANSMIADGTMSSDGKLNHDALTRTR